MRVENSRYGRRLPWADILLSAVASVSWALIAMAGTAALGLHLLEADSAASLGPMTAAVVALAAGGSVTPSGDVSAFGLKGAEATTAIEITPLGVSLVGALFLSWFFLRSLRTAGVVVAPAELLARAGAVTALFVATLGGLAWAGHDVITIDGGSLGLDDLPGGSGSGGLEIPGLGDVGDIGGLLPDRVGDLIDAEAAVGFSVDTPATLLGGLVWSAGVLLIALLASRRTPLPLGWDAVHRVVRPAVSALVAVLLVAVAAGLAAAGYAAVGDDHPKRIAGAALLGAPNGVWLGIPLGLFVPWDGEASGALTRFLPDPLDDLLVDTDQPVTLGRLAELDGRVWLLAVAAALAMLLAGVLQAVRTPVREPGALGFAGRCALRLGLVTAVALPLLAWLTEVSLDASLSVLGFDAFGAGLELSGRSGTALLLGALWGAGAGAAGALLALATGAAGRRAAPFALGDVGTGTGGPGGTGAAGPYVPGAPYRPPNPDTNPYLRVPEELRESRGTWPPPGAAPGSEAPRASGTGWPGAGPSGAAGPSEGVRAPAPEWPPPGTPRPGRAPRPDGARPADPEWPPPAGRPSGAARPPGDAPPPEDVRPPRPHRPSDATPAPDHAHRPPGDTGPPHPRRPPDTTPPPPAHRPPAGTLPYGAGQPAGTLPYGTGQPSEGGGTPGDVPDRSEPVDDVYGAPTVVRPVEPPPRRPKDPPPPEEGPPPPGRPRGR